MKKHFYPILCGSLAALLTGISVWGVLYSTPYFALYMLGALCWCFNLHLWRKNAYWRSRGNHSYTGTYQGTIYYSGGGAMRSTASAYTYTTGYYTRTSTSLTPEAMLKHSERTEPITAWKIAFIEKWRVKDGMKCEFIPINADFTHYGVESRAVCHANDGPGERIGVQVHPYMDTPMAWCTCGFYALPTWSDAVEASTRPTYIFGAKGNEYYRCILEVELYGKVIKHQFGYRAEKMRVMKVFAIDREAKLTEKPIRCDTEWEWTTLTDIHREA